MSLFIRKRSVQPKLDTVIYGSSAEKPIVYGPGNSVQENLKVIR